MTVERDKIDVDLEAQIAALTEEAIEEMYEGAPASFSEPGNHSPQSTPVDDFVPHIDPTLSAAGEDKVVLVNLRFPNEVVMLTDDDDQWNGRSVEFHDGHLVVDRAIAAQVKLAAPYVYEEPTEGYVFTHSTTGFKTRSPEGFERYSLIYAQNL